MARLTNTGNDPRPHPAWWQGAVVYEIYPRSFADADGDGVGDLRGVVARLDHLASGPGGLGVDPIWLTPFYPSGGVDGGYDVTEYCQVDPAYGSLEDSDHLVAEAHGRGLRVIVDWVPNHTSDKHPWFVEARASRDAPRRDWYVWADGRDGEPPNNWLSAFDDVGPAWKFDDASGQWYLHSYSPHQPDLNWDNPEVRAAMHDVMRFWLRRGVDGFRIDVADGLGKDPALGDNPWPIVNPRANRPVAAMTRTGTASSTGSPSCARSPTNSRIASWWARSMCSTRRAWPSTRRPCGFTWRTTSH